MLSLFPCLNFPTSSVSLFTLGIFQLLPSESSYLWLPTLAQVPSPYGCLMTYLEHKFDQVSTPDQLA